MAIKLIALAVIAAGALAADSAEIAVGVAFEAPDDLAAKLIADGLAKEDVPPPTKVKTTRVRVLSDCTYGKPNDVVDIPSTDLKQAKADGTVDDDKAAVAYAMGLKAQG